MRNPHEALSPLATSLRNLAERMLASLTAKERQLIQQRLDDTIYPPARDMITRVKALNGALHVVSEQHTTIQAIPGWSRSVSIPVVVQTWSDGAIMARWFEAHLLAEGATPEEACVALAAEILDVVEDMRTSARAPMSTRKKQWDTVRRELGMP